MKERHEGIERRRFVYMLGTASVVLTLPTGTTVAQDGEDQDVISVTVDNVGVVAWEVTDADEEVATFGEENPEITLTIGERYSFENLGWQSHPFEFRDEDGNPLLSQSSAGEFEDDEDVNWVDGDEVFSFTVTEELAGELNDYVCTVHRPMTGTVETVAADEEGDDIEPSVEFEDQALGTIEDSESAVFGTVSAEEDSWIIVTYEEGGESVAASVGQLDGTVEDATVGITVETESVPGDHTMHVVGELGDEYQPGETISDETASNVLSQDTATVFDVELGFEDQTFEGPTDKVTVETASLFDGSGNDTLFVVNLYPTNEDNEIVGGRFLGSSEVVSGENENLTVNLQTTGGESVEIDETDDYFAVVHLVDDEDTEEGESYPPGTFDALEKLSDGEAFPVSDGATVTIEEVEEEGGEDGDNETDDGSEDEEGEEDEEGQPGFGLVAGAAAVLGGGALRRWRSSDKGNR